MMILLKYYKLRTINQQLKFGLMEDYQINEKIKGIMVSQEEHKIALFADDMLIYLGHPSSSLPELLTTLREYGLLSGYKLNTHKFQILTFNYSPS